MLVSRRSLLRAAVAAPAFSLPRILRAQSQSTLRFIPVIDLTFVDPIYSTAQVSRNHGFMVYDTLYGMNSGLEVSPQMVSGHVVSSDDRQWDLTLRDGLLWHDGERVLARDCVASIRRWATRDGFGAELMAATDELSAPDNRTIRFRLNRPFPLLPVALGKSAIQAPFMMPERLASQDAFKPLTEVVGSGPFRFVADERVPGARNVYARFDRYQPRQDGKPDWTAGPKIVHYDRVVWTTMPDAATGVAALQTREQDWQETTLQHRQQVVPRCFLPVLLARLQRSTPCRRIRHRRPDHAIVMNDLGTGGPIRLAVLAGLIPIEAGVHVARARDALVRNEAERAAAYDFGQRLERVLARQPLGHHERRLDRRFAERRGQQRERPVQSKADGTVVRR